MLLDLHRLRHFLAVLEDGKISAAAARQHITQSALSRSLQGLEIDLRTQLFRRSSRGVELTPAGRRLREHAERVINSAEAAERDLLSYVHGGTSTLKVGVHYELTEQPFAVAAFRTLTELPQLSMTVIEGSHSGLLPSLQSGGLDLLLTIAPPDLTYPGLELEPLFDAPVCVTIVARRGHPLLRSRSRQPHRLTNADWIMPDCQHLERVLDAYFARLGQPVPQFRLKAAAGSPFFRNAVLNHDCFALISGPTMPTGHLEGMASLPGSTVTFTYRGGIMSTTASIRSSGYEALRKHLRRVLHGAKVAGARK